MADDYDAGSVQEPEETTSSQPTVSFLIGKQIDRINYLFSVRLSLGLDLNTRITIANSLIYSIGALEALFLPRLKKKEYFEESEKIKKILFEPIGQKVNEYELIGNLKEDITTQFFLYEKNPNVCFKYCLEWYSLLTKYGKETDVYPTDKVIGFFK